MSAPPHRAKRLGDLIEERFQNSQTKFALRTSMSASYVNQLLRGHVTFGDQPARKIEIAHDLPGGWLDSDEPLPPSSATYAHAKPAPKLAQEPPAAYASARYECYKIIDGLPAEACERLLPVLQMLAKAADRPA